jgi:hypothetical protein
MLLALFGLIPLGLFSRLGHLAIAAGVVLFYVTVVTALTLVWMKRADHALSGRRFAALAVECLTCPPFALNLVRHLSLGGKPGQDFLAVIDQCLTGAERNAALAQAVTRIRNEIDWEDEGSPRATTLNTHLQFLTREGES